MSILATAQICNKMAKMWALRESHSRPLRWRGHLLAVCCLVFVAFSSPDFLFRKRTSASSYADNDAFRNIKEYGAVLAETAPSVFD